MQLQFDDTFVQNIVSKAEVDSFIFDNKKILKSILRGEQGLQNFTGWLSVKKNADQPTVELIKNIAAEIKKNADAFVVVGVGGSNRTALTLIECLKNLANQNSINNSSQNVEPIEIYYAGNNLSGYYIRDLLLKLEKKDFYINVIAKDFHTLEPGITFRLLRDLLFKKYGNDWQKRVIVTGSYGDDQLFNLAQKENIRFLEFPKEVGGRFSAFTAVTFLPICVASVDLDSFIQGGIEAENACAFETEAMGSELKNLISVRYAVNRYLLSQKGFFVENMVGFEPCFETFLKWAQQLHGESEGKNQQSILPIFSNFSEDLHAMGQYIQQGRKCIFEVFFDIRKKTDIKIKADFVNDGFSYLDGKKYDCMNEAVFSGSLKAHNEAGIPIMIFSATDFSAKTFGELFYTFMLSSYISSVLISVEPFDQPGVENYKQNMYAQLKQ